MHNSTIMMHVYKTSCCKMKEQTSKQAKWTVTTLREKAPPCTPIERDRKIRCGCASYRIAIGDDDVDLMRATETTHPRIKTQSLHISIDHNARSKHANRAQWTNHAQPWFTQFQMEIYFLQNWFSIRFNPIESTLLLCRFFFSPVRFLHFIDQSVFYCDLW